MGSLEAADFIRERVHDYYWNEDLNCATTMLKVLAEIFAVRLEPQVLASATGMHGAGKFGAQCGLVEGALMFLGIWAASRELPGEEAVVLCYHYAHEFQGKFHSLVCKELRPRGFQEDDPPHLCEELTKNAVYFTANYIRNQAKIPADFKD
ncbi:MAG: C-GCAxxG-C-C family protein [Peptococcaceae bacterium]